MLKHNESGFYAVVSIIFQVLNSGDLSHYLVFSNIDETVKEALCVISGICRSHNHAACANCN